VSTEQKTSNPTEPRITAGSAIENEIPAYRAISPGAVAALILGMMSVLSFAYPYFLILPVLAVLIGFRADRKIQRLPDMLTGRGIAQAGVGLGLIFGLCSVSIDGVQGFLRKNQAKQCALEYLDHVKKDTIEQLMWLGQAPARRASTTPEAMAEELRKNPEGEQKFEMQFAGVRGLKQAASAPGSEVHFEGIETHGLDGLTPYAGAVFDVHVPNAPTPEQKENSAFVLMKAAQNPKTTRYEWYVESVQYPYKRASYTTPTKPVDDGHGHGH
jgi:hypothetical protein